MLNNLKDKKVLIIGGTSGIGKEIALQAGALGAELIITGRTPENIEQTEKELSEKGFSYKIIHFEAYDSQSVTDLFKEIKTIDHLVSMIGDVMGGGFLTSDLETIKHVVNSKFYINLDICRSASGKINKGGSITLTSGSGRHPHEASASFIGNQNIQLLIESLAIEMAPDIRVNTVAPFWMDTPFWRKMNKDEKENIKSNLSSVIPLQRTALVEEVAFAYIFLMLNTFVTGQKIAVDGGIMLS